MGNKQSTPQKLPQEDIDEINKLVSKEPEEMRRYLEDKCNAWKNTKVTIGLIGESHRGKSSFINASRNLKPGDPGAAAVKNKECTTEPKSYEFPGNSKITLIDLPGFGTNNFRKDEYLKKIEFTRYDFFLIFSKDSFTETDTWMATKLKETNKPFFFIRAFMDIAVNEALYDKNVKIRQTDDAGNLTREMKTFMNQEMEETRDYARDRLKFSNNDDVPIYCISNRFRERYEFPKLLLDIASHLPEIQKQALTLSTNFFTEEYFKAKKKILKEKIIGYAALAGLAGAIPIPGIDLLVDVPFILNILKSFKQQFNIDYEKDSDGGFSKDHKKVFFTVSGDKMLEVKQILSGIAKLGTSSSLNAAFVNWAGTGVLHAATKAASVASLGILVAVASVIGGTISFAFTYHLLSTELDKIEKLANEAVKLKIEKMLE